MNQELPPFVYSKAFWEAASVLVAGALGLLAFFGYVDSDWAVPAAAILAWIFGLLRMFGITPELQAKQLEEQLRETRQLLEEAQVVRNDLLGFKKSEKGLRKSK